jgi:hypothetical protein
MQVSFGESASAVVQAHTGVYLGEQSTATINGTLTTPDIRAGASAIQVNGTLNGDISMDTRSSSGLITNGSVVVAGVQNGSLSVAGDARATVSGTHNGALNIASRGLYGANLSGTQNGAVNLSSGVLALTDSVLNLGGNSTWSGGTITGSGSSQINLGNGATWAISGADKSLTGVPLNVLGTLNLGTTGLTLDRPLSAAAGSTLAFSAAGITVGQFGHISAPSISLDATGVNLSLTAAGGYGLGMGDQFKVLTAADAPAARAVFSSGTVNVAGPVNYLIAPVKTGTDLTLVVSNFIPIGLPGTTVAGIVGAGSISGYVQGQTAAGWQSFLSAAAAASTASLPASPITLP